MDIVGLVFLAVIFGLLGWVLGIVGFFKAQRALRELAALRPAEPAVVAAAPAIAPAWAAPLPAPEPVDQAVILTAAAPVSEPERQPAPPARPRIDIEVLLTQRWGMWLGAAALVLAAVFLVRTAVELGWLGPATRCVLAALFGFALAGAAEWLRRRPPATPGLIDLAPSALAAASVGAWFAASYAAGPLYGLVSVMAGFILLAASGLAGLALSLRFGQLVAAVGLTAAFVTPLLVQTEHPSVPGLFSYLLFVSAAAWAVVRYTAWTWLGWASAGASAVWVLAIAVSGNVQDMWAPALFVPAAAALSVILLPGAALDHPAGRWLSWAPLLLLGCAGLLLAALAGDATARIGVLLLAPVAVGKGWMEPRLAWLPFLPALLFLGVLLTWALPTWQPTDELVTIEGAVQAVLPGAWAPGVIVPLLETAAAMAAWFAAAGLFLERRAPRPLPWAALAASVPVATLAVTYAQVGQFQPIPVWALAAAALAAGLVGAAWLARPATGGLQRAGVHAAGAVAALALGCAIVLDEGWLTLAVALMLPALAWIEGAADLPPLRRVSLGVALLVLVRLVLNPYVLAYRAGTWPVLNPLLLAYGVPAICFAAAAVLFRRRRDDQLVGVLEAGACTILTLGAGLEVHHWATDGDMRQADWTFHEMALLVTVLGALALLLQWVAARGQRPVIAAAWQVVGAVALIGAVGLILANPALTDASVGGSLLGNALLPAYAIPALLALAAARTSRWIRAWLARFAFVAAFTWLTLEVRQAFHPDALSLSHDISDAELWAYSGAWLLLGAGLMTAGLRTGLRSLRLAALGLIALTTAKVFLVDMAELHSLWRVLSFLGLGLSLVGLGAFYRRFVVPAPRAA